MPRADDKRGSSYDRRARKEFLLAKHGDGVTCPCKWCGKTLTFETVTADRIKPGLRGGGYTRRNIVPACMACNCRRGAMPARAFKQKVAACG
jgi:hypothetical protein